MKLLLLLLTPFVLYGQTQVRVNVGGGSYVDLSGNTWAADTQCTSSLTFTRGSNIANTVDPTLYLTGRTDPSAVSCDFPVTNNTFFFVTLRFAETDPAITKVGQRIFNVFVNGILARSALDVYALTLAKNTALDLAIGPVPVSNSHIIITLATVGGNGPILQAASAISASSGGDSTWTNSGGFIYNNNGGGVHIGSTDFNAYNANLYNPAGSTRLNMTAGSVQGTDPLAVFNGVDVGYQGTIDANGGHETYINNKRKITQSGALSLFSNAICQSWSNKDDLNDPTEVYDSQICRESTSLIRFQDNTSALIPIKVSKVIVNSTGIEGSCDATQRGRIVFTQGGAGVADTLRQCRKDAADAYAWTALY